MPRQRRLSGQQVLRILQRFGFDIIRVRGSHHVLRRVVDGHKQTLTIPIHGNKVLPAGTLGAIYRQALAYIPEDELFDHFYTN